MTKWLTVEEIARHLRTTPSTVYKLKERGQIRGYRAGRRLIFDADEVDTDIKRARKKKLAARQGRAPNAHQRKVS